MTGTASLGPKKRRSIGGHESPVAQTDTWLTPPELLRKLGDFDLDPCCPPNMPWRTAAVMFTKEDDGLGRPWSGRCFVNPPYGSEAAKWLRRLADHGRGTALTFARTETEWFVETIWKRASAILFIYGRLHFHFPDGRRAPANAGAPSVLAAYGGGRRRPARAKWHRGHVPPPAGGRTMTRVARGQWECAA